MSSKRILFLTQYFHPDLSACSFRSKALVESLLRKDNDILIDVITTHPSRYDSYRPKANDREVNPNLTIQRVTIPQCDNNFRGEVKCFFSYAKQVLQLVSNEQYDLVYATSSKLMSAALAASIAKKRGIPLYLDVRDLFIENVSELFSKRAKLITIPILNILERYAFEYASRINVVSEGFMPYVLDKYPSSKISTFTNGIDDIFIQTVDSASSCKIKTTNLEVIYAGNIGRAQALDRILPAFAKRLKGKIRLKIIGDGRCKSKLVDKLSKLNIHNVEILSPISRDKLNDVYNDADVLFLHLDDCDSFGRVIPSKIFEYAASGKPILCGVSAFTRRFIEENIDNAAVFNPCDVNDAIDKFNSLDMKMKSRDDFVATFSRNVIMESMADDILAVL